MQEKEIEEKVKKLPEQLREKVLKYVDYLLLQQQDRKHKKARGLLEKHKNVRLHDNEKNAWAEALVDKYENS